MRLNPCEVRLNIEMNIPAGGSMRQRGVVRARVEGGGQGVSIWNPISHVWYPISSI